MEKINKFFKILTETKDPAFDVETNGLDWKKCYVCGYSVSDGVEGVYIPVRHALDRGGDGNISNVSEFERQLNIHISNMETNLVAHNAKFDMHFSANHGVIIADRIKDTMVRAALLDENRTGYSLAAVAKSYNIEQKKGNELYEHIGNLFGLKPNAKHTMGHFHRLSGDDPLANSYAAGDTITTKQLYDKQAMDLYEQELDVVEGMESNLIPVLQKMERRGVRIDPEETEKMKAIVHDLHMEAFRNIPLRDDILAPININSSKDLKEYFEWCEIDDWPFTLPTTRHPNGQPSFNKDYLGTHDEGLYILEARKFNHLVNSFIEPLDGHIHNDRIHTTFNQAKVDFNNSTQGTKSGRLSSTNPNMQQVTKRDEQIGKIFRKIFVPDKDFILVEYDHSQAEPRLYAHYSGEEVLIEGYNKTPFVDMHTIAAELMHVSRGVAKNLNLGMMYTMGAKKLAKKLKISEDSAYAITRSWHSIFRSVSGFTRKAETRAQERGWVKTILGRRARFPDPRWAYRAANRIIQGSSADILKWKMVAIDRWITKNKYGDVVHMLLNIHDAIVFQIHKDYLHLIPEIGSIFANVQCAPFNLRVPFYADYHQGKDWAQASYGEH